MALIYKYSQLTERMPYEEVKNKECVSKKMHLGQLKLFMSEILFLSKVSKSGNIVLYVGSAEGYHISMLSDMFPDLEYHLWDPNKFKLSPRKNIKLFNNFFTDDDAKNYSKNGNNILFISDIRNSDIAKKTTVEEIDDLIIDDNDKQIRWVQTIKPIASYLKFRLPYKAGKSKYFDGKIYLQPYSPISTETRLMSNKYDLIEYDNIEFDEKMAYFNCNIRTQTNYSRFEKIMKKHNIKNNWDNNFGFYILHLYLDKIKQVEEHKLDEEIVQLFLKIINFLKIRYGNRYDILFDK